MPPKSSKISSVSSIHKSNLMTLMIPKSKPVSSKQAKNFDKYSNPTTLWKLKQPKPKPKPVVVRDVWAKNLEVEMLNLQLASRTHSVISIDTEFPGTIYKPDDPKFLYPELSYALMKKNVDDLKMIQLGITVSDHHGNLPTFGTKFCYVWQFNFRDFDVDCDLQNSESISLLEKQGMDFKKNREMGIDSLEFALLFWQTGLILNYPLPSFTWVTFQGGYDFGFLFKVLTKQKLPDDLSSFIGMVGLYFGYYVYDVKCLLSSHKVYGGLNMLAKTLQVKRIAGKSHQAGSDSLLTMQTLMKIHDKFCDGVAGTLQSSLNGFEWLLYGMEVVKVEDRSGHGVYIAAC